MSGIALFFTWIAYISATAIMLVIFVDPKFAYYRILEGPQSPFRIRIGVLGYCVTVGDGCVGPPAHISWTFESVGTYLNANLTKHVNQLERSITPGNTHRLGLTNVLLLVFNICGSIISSTLFALSLKRASSFQLKRGIALLLAFCTFVTCATALTTIIVSYGTGSTLAERIKKATNGTLELVKVNGYVKYPLFKGEPKTTPPGLRLLIGPVVNSICSLVLAYFVLPQKPKPKPKDPRENNANANTNNDVPMETRHGGSTA